MLAGQTTFPAAADPRPAAPAYHDLAHYHAFSPIVRKPPHSAALGRSGGAPLEARQLLIAVLASCALPDRLRVADETWCSPHHHDGVRCVAYVDCDEPPPTTGALIVPASEYMDPWHAPHGECCDEEVKYRAPDGWDGVGPSRYYCASEGPYSQHAMQTLAAQYRFMPALRHATSLHMRDDTRWLVMVDDDSWVALPRLLQVLDEHNHEEPLQVRQPPLPLAKLPPCQRAQPPCPLSPRSWATLSRRRRSTTRTGSDRSPAVAPAPSSPARQPSAPTGHHACESTRAPASSPTG